MTKIVLPSPIPVKRKVETSSCLEKVEEFAIHLPDHWLVLWIGQQVAGLEGIFAQIKEFIRIPDAVVVDVLVPIPTQRVDRWSLGEVALPIVLIEQLCSPVLFGPSDDAEETSPIHRRRRTQASRLEEGRRDVDVGHHLLDRLPTGDQFWALQEHRNPHRLLVGGTLVDQAVLTKSKAIVAHVEYQGGVEQVLPPQPVVDPCHAVVHPEEGLSIPFVIVGNIQI